MSADAQRAGGAGDPYAILAGACSRRKFQRGLVRAAMAGCEAECGALYERSERGTWCSVVIEGLFPPPEPLSPERRAALRTRAQWVEWVLRPVELAEEAGVIGRMSDSDTGELVADAENDVRCVRHADPALALRSLIVVPVRGGVEWSGVLALANPADGGAFRTEDFSNVQSLVARAAEAWAAVQVRGVPVE